MILKTFPPWLSFLIIKIIKSKSHCKKVIFGMRKHSNDPLEPVWCAMCFNIVQVHVSEWLRSTSAVQVKNVAHSHWFYVQAKGECHATDAVVTCGPDWQARLQTDAHVALWSSISSDTAMVMNMMQLHSLKDKVIKQTAVCMSAHVHMSVWVC